MQYVYNYSYDKTIFSLNGWIFIYLTQDTSYLSVPGYMYIFRQIKKVS